MLSDAIFEFYGIFQLQQNEKQLSVIEKKYDRPVSASKQLPPKKFERRKS